MDHVFGLGPVRVAPLKFVVARDALSLGVACAPGNEMRERVHIGRRVHASTATSAQMTWFARAMSVRELPLCEPRLCERRLCEPYLRRAGKSGRVPPWTFNSLT